MFNNEKIETFQKVNHPTVQSNHYAGDTIASQEDAELLILGRQDLITQLGVLREGRMPEPEAGLLAALAGLFVARRQRPDWLS